jgi:hypothetical protein
MSIKVSVGWVEGKATRAARGSRRRSSETELELEDEDLEMRRSGFVLASKVDDGDDDEPPSAWAW